MKRRAFVTGLGVVLVAPRAIEAQQARSMPRLCVLAYESLSPSSPWAQRYRAFVEGLRDLGYVDRRSITIHFLSADGDYNRFPPLPASASVWNRTLLLRTRPREAWPPKTRLAQSQSSPAQLATPSGRVWWGAWHDLGEISPGRP